jgi:hypothetical protein
MCGELESVDMIFFMMEGQIDIGYEMNRINYFKIRIPNTFVVGAFECSYNRRSQVIYKSHKQSSCFILRRSNWHLMSQFFPDYYKDIRRRFLFLYNTNIRRHINESKRQDEIKF